MSVQKKYKDTFNYAPVAILELDYSFLTKIEQQLKKQTVTNIRQFLFEHSYLIINNYHNIRIKEANQNAYDLFGVRNKTELLHSFVKTFATSATDVLIEQVVAILNKEERFGGEFKSKFCNNKFLDIFIRISVVENKKFPYSRIIVALQDITMWKRLERQLRKKAQLDSLTKLLNHNAIMRRLEEELIRAKRYGLSLSCMMIDMDHFKVVNDKFGHQRGDQVLKRVATMIKNSVRTVDIVGRYGGDEFLLVLPETKPMNAKYAANRIQHIFNEKLFRYQKMISFHISLSIGITGYPSSKVKDSKDLITLADRAMYSAKKAGRNRISINVG